jgi:hypothetical protein
MSAPAEQRHHWLDRAEQAGWSVSQLRASIAEEKAKKTITESEKDQESSNDADPTASAEQYDDESETSTGGEPEPDQETEDDSADTAAEEEEHRRYLRQIAMEEVQRDAENREILCNILRGRIEGESEVFKDFIDQFTVDSLLDVLSLGRIARLRTRLAEPKGKRKAESESTNKDSAIEPPPITAPEHEQKMQAAFNAESAAPTPEPALDHTPTSNGTPGFLAR